MMRQVTAVVWFAVLVGPASAASCGKSLDYILNDLPDQLPRPASAYQMLFRTCQQTLTLPNEQDAFILRDGGVAVIPRDPGVIATAQTLAQFCRKFPRDTLRFIDLREQRRGLTTGLVVMMSSTRSQSCQVIMGTK